ncbi:MAG: VCBS repeat-containing protein, partial [Saprospiraceae bacterium]
MRALLSLATVIFATFTLSAQSINFNQHVIANGLSLLRDVKMVDMDDDGDLDILVTGGSEIDWFINLDGKGNFDSIPIIVGMASNVNVVFAADIDKNGTMDVLVGTGTNSTNSGVSV